MNPWGIVVAFAGFLMVYVGVKGTQGNIVKLFSKTG